MNKIMMKKALMTIVLLASGVLGLMAQKMSFVVKGPEDKYNQIRVLNETSQEELTCRVVILSEDKEDAKEVYGVYHLKKIGDIDSNTKWLDAGTTVGIEIEKDFPVKVDFSVEYKDYPFFDAIVIHLYDKGTF